jgi:hypothetical protein
MQIRHHALGQFGRQLDGFLVARHHSRPPSLRSRRVRRCWNCFVAALHADGSRIGTKGHQGRGGGISGSTCPEG